MQQDQAQKLFEAGGFFILPLDKKGTEFGIDGSLWAVKDNSFAGVKFLPPGFHLFVYSAPPSTATLESEGLPASTSATPFGEGITIRHGLLRFSKPKEIIVRKYDSGDEIVQEGSGETLEEDDDVEEMEDIESTVAKRFKSSTGSSIALNTSSTSGIEGTIISPDYLKTLDPKLAPYPFEKQTEWKRLTSLITSKTLNTVLGFDGNGDSRCDSLMSSLADEFEGIPSSSSSKIDKPKSQWGKERQINELDEMDRVNNPDYKNGKENDWQEDVKKGKEKCMRFANFNLKRSWRIGALGEEITKNSRDKSWLLKHVVDTQTGGSENELLAQMQLAFVIFTQLHNFSALDSYKSLLSLFSRSISTFLPSSNGLPPIRSIPLYVNLLDQVLLPHIEYLRTEFFEQDLPGLDGFIQEEIANLRMSLRAAYRHYFPESTQTRRNTAQIVTSQLMDEDSNLSIQFKDLCAAWERLRIASENKFGWLLGRLEPDDVTLLRQQKGRIEYNLLSEADEDDEYREEGDDAPVVVEL